MTEDSVKVVCSECEAELPLDWVSKTSDLRNCPECGANARTIHLVFSDYLEIRDQVRGKVKSNDLSIPKKKRIKKEFIAGHERSVARNGWVEKQRLIDRENGRYKEKVVDSVTGEVLRNVDEPIRDHVGRGSAKNRG